MFHMVNPSGNAHQNVNTEKKRDERLAAGWKLVEEETTAEELEQADEPQQATEEGTQDATRDDVMSAFMAIVAPANDTAKGTVEDEGKHKKGKTKKNAAEE